MRVAQLLLGAASASAACTQTYTNKASTAMTLCKRHNGATPGAAGSKTLQPGESWSEPCVHNQPYESNVVYFTTRDLSTCPTDTCDPPTQTCKSYPWWMGQGISPDNGNWYGGIGINWDGDTHARGWTGDYGSNNVHYGLQFTCDAYNATQHVSLKCTVMGGKPTCTPDHPAPGNMTNSGTVMCDPTNLQLDIVDAPCAASEYCCPEAKHCLTPVIPVVDCEHNNSVCGDATCCPVTNECVTVGAPCTAPPKCGTDEYCCPDAKHCLKPVESPICASATDCNAGEVCCPVTKECVKVGAACTSNCTSADAYCCPDAKKCLTPVKPEVSCASDASVCAAGDVCCPVTKLCVSAGANCTPSPECGAAEYCCPDAKHCLTPTYTQSITACETAADCGAGGTCCPLTKICVAVGAACDPLYPSGA